VEIDDPTPPEKLKCTVHTFVRPLDQFPPNFESQAKINAKGSITPMKNERMLLSSFLGKNFGKNSTMIFIHKRVQ